MKESKPDISIPLLKAVAGGVASSEGIWSLVTGSSDFIKNPNPSTFELCTGALITAGVGVYVAIQGVKEALEIDHNRGN